MARESARSKALLGFAIVMTLTASSWRSNWSAVLLAQTGAAQSAAAQSPTFTFEVASIRPHDPKDTRSGNYFQGEGRWIASNYSLRQLVRAAYQMQDYRIIGGPDWADRDRFDVDARVAPEDLKASAQGGVSVRLLMARALLAERFKLQVRREQREMPVFALTMARTDRKLGESLRSVAKRDCVNDAPETWCGIRGIGPGKIAGQQVTMPAFVAGLTGTFDRVIVDRTGLEGLFDFTVQYSPRPIQPPPSPSAASPAGTTGGAPPVAAEPPTGASGVTVFAALEEQLGLRLREERASVEVIVIESVEKPSPN